MVDEQSMLVAVRWLVNGCPMSKDVRTNNRRCSKIVEVLLVFSTQVLLLFLYCFVLICHLSFFLVDQLVLMVDQLGRWSDSELMLFDIANRCYPEFWVEVSVGN